MTTQTYPFQLPSLPYAPDALEPHFDARTISIHHDEHHRVYVERLNAALKDHPELHDKTIEYLLRNLNRIPSGIRTAVRNDGGGHLNHALFWSLIGVPGKGTPTGALLEALLDNFGSLDAFHAKFREVATGHFASGWVFLVADSRKNALEVLAMPDHHCVLGTHQTVLLVCDVWEHAYYLKHQQKRADYVDCWWQVANWHEAARRFDRPVEAAA
ncbi:MAG: superoxide dismutase [Proteobacteria bacterium]|nr:superoxide dismutase [Pseudomonadota bacterium]